MKLVPELSRPIEVSRIPATGCTETIVADSKECALIAQRLELPAIHGLKAELALSRWRGQGVKVAGTITADIEQTCVVTLDDFRSNVSETVERYFLSGDSSANEDADVDSFTDGVIELGEVVVESVSLALDPYPRKPGAVFAENGDDSVASATEENPSPFAVLARLRAPKR